MMSADIGAAVARLWQRAEQLLGAARLDDAHATAGELVELLRDAPADQVPHDPDYAAALGLLAYTTFLRGDAEAADALYAEAIDRSRRGGEESGVKRGRILLSYGISLIEREQAQAARAALAEAVEAMRTAAARLDTQARDLLREVSRRAAALGDVQLAEAALLSVTDAFTQQGEPAAVPMAAYFDSLSQVRQLAGRPADAEAPARTAIRLAKIEGLSPQNRAALASRMADLLFSLDRDEETLEATDAALELAGDDATIRCNSLGLQSLVHERRGAREAAIETLQAAIEAANEALGPHAPPTIRLHERRANLLTELRRYAEALPHRSLLAAVAEARAGRESTAYGDALTDLAVALDQTGEYAEARVSYRRALRLLRRLFGEHHPRVVTLRRNLAELARITGELERAERRFAELVEMLADDDSGGGRSAARTWLGYGLTLNGLGKHETAASALENARALTAESDGVDAPAYGRVLLALGQVENARRRYGDAVRHLGQARDLLHDAPGWHTTAEAAEIELADARLHTAPSAASIDAAEELLSRVRERLGVDHPVSGIYGRQLAVGMVRIGAFEPARRALEAAEPASRSTLIEALRSPITSRVNETMEQLQQFRHLHLSLVMSGAQRDRQSIEAAYGMLSSRNGAETTVLRLRNRRRAADRSPALVQEAQELRSKITRLQTRLAASPEPTATEADISRYQEQLDDVESRLGSMVQRARLEQELLDDHFESLVARLPERAAVVEFTEYSHLTPGADDPFAGEHRYAAFVVRGRREAPELVDIGARISIDQRIDQFRNAMLDYRSSSWREPGLELQRAIFGALREALAGIERLVVVPAGRIGVLPLASLPVDEQRHVIDEFEITYRFSSRQIRGVSFEEDIGKGASPVVIGAPDYGARRGDAAADPLDDSEFLGRFRSARFDPLPEARAECQAIATLLGVEPRLGNGADEASMHALRSPELLHVSTHGFYMDVRGNDRGGAAPAEIAGIDVVPGRVSVTDPLERSGLALAGANTYLDEALPPVGAGDGILYAAEVAGLDLMRTDLVTLSACQTGLGEVRSGDGVHSLQRAFATAGARCIVCSLVDVPEKPTRKLFTRLYEQVLAGRPRADAFHDVVRELAQDYRETPVAWGGFVLYGETGVLPRFDPVRQIDIVSLRLPPRTAQPESGSQTPAQEAERWMGEGHERIAERDTDGAIAAFTRAAEVEGVPGELRARAVYERAGVHRSSGALEQALADYDWLGNAAGIPDRLREASAGDRGTTLALAGRFEEAVEALTGVLAGPGLTLDDRAFLLNNRAYCWTQLGREAEALCDLSEVIDTPGSPPAQRAKALVNRSDLHINSGRLTECEADARRALDIDEGLPPDVAGAHINLGRSLAAQGLDDAARESYARARAVDGAPAHFAGIRKRSSPG